MICVEMLEDLSRARAVSDRLADSKSVTGPGWKKNVNMDPTRFTQMPSGT